MIVDSKQIAEIFGVSVSAIRKWHTFGLQYTKKGNKRYYDTKKAIDWYLDYKRPIENIGEMSAEEADIRLKIAREKMLKLDYAVKKGKLIEIERLDEQMALLGNLFISELRQCYIKLPQKLKKIADRHIKNMIEKIKEKIKNDNSG